MSIILNQKCWLKLIIQSTNIYEEKHMKIINNILNEFLMIPFFWLLVIVNNSINDKSIRAIMVKVIPKNIKATLFLQ